MRKRRRRPKLNTTAGEGSQFFPGVQKKLAVGTPGDAFEVEADKMADAVVSGAEGSALQKKGAEEEIQQKPLADSISSVQKKDMPADEEPVQKAVEEEEPIQKMEEEEEAVQSKEEEEPIQKMEEEEAVQSKEEEDPIQKMEEEEAVQSKEEEETVQQKSANTTQNRNYNTEAKLKQQSGKGSKMDASTEKQMEKGFGADFSNVNIHTDSASEELSSNLGAQAFTHGNDIYFNKGKYNPNSKEGKHLLAHELTHTIQQNSNNKNIQKEPNSSGTTTKTGFERLKELKGIYDTTILTPAQEAEFINVLNPLINGTTLPQIGIPNIVPSPSDDKFQPKQIYFETSRRHHFGRPAVTKRGIYEDGEIKFKKTAPNIQTDACIIISPSIVMDTLSHTLSLLEHEGVHIYQNYNNKLGNEEDDEVMGYSRQFKRIFDFSEAEIKNLLFQWVKVYVEADKGYQSHSLDLISKYLPKSVTNDGADKVLKVIPNVLDNENSKRISPRMELKINAIFGWLTGLLQSLKI